MGIFSRKKKQDQDKKEKEQQEVAEVTSAEKKEDEVKMKDLYDEEGKARKEEPVDRAVKGKKTEKKVSTKKGLGKDAYKVLVKPLISEKASSMGVDSKYVFVVSSEANKIMVKKAIEQVYGIKPINVNIINNKGKQVKSRNIRGKRKDWKKAVVTLPKGQSIQIYEGV